MRKACPLVLLMILFLLLVSCGIDCSKQNREEYRYNAFVKIVVTIVTVVIKAIVTLVFAALAILALVMTVMCVPIDLILCLFSLDWIFPLTRFSWCLTIFLKDSIIELWSAVPPYFLYSG